MTHRFYRPVEKHEPYCAGIDFRKDLLCLGSARPAVNSPRDDTAEKPEPAVNNCASSR